jgi:hypothetical protein
LAGNFSERTDPLGELALGKHVEKQFQNHLVLEENNGPGTGLVQGEYSTSTEITAT